MFRTAGISLLLFGGKRLDAVARWGGEMNWVSSEVLVSGNNNSPVYKALWRLLSHWIIGPTVWHRLLSPVLKQPKRRDVLWTCPSVRVGKLQSPAFQAGSFHSRSRVPIWTKYLTHSTEGSLSLASLKKKKQNFMIFPQCWFWSSWESFSLNLLEDREYGTIWIPRSHPQPWPLWFFSRILWNK